MVEKERGLVRRRTLGLSLLNVWKEMYVMWVRDRGDAARESGRRDVSGREGTTSGCGPSKNTGFASRLVKKCEFLSSFDCVGE